MCLLVLYLFLQQKKNIGSELQSSPFLVGISRPEIEVIATSKQRTYECLPVHIAKKKKKKTLGCHCNGRLFSACLLVIIFPKSFESTSAKYYSNTILTLVGLSMP